MVDAPALAAPTLRVTSVARKLLPTSVVADGSSTEVTARSGVGTVTCTLPLEARQLLLSSVSPTTAMSSAQASRR